MLRLYDLEEIYKVIFSVEQPKVHLRNQAAVHLIYDLIYSDRPRFPSRGKSGWWRMVHDLGVGEKGLRKKQELWNGHFTPINDFCMWNRPILLRPATLLPPICYVPHAAVQHSCIRRLSKGAHYLCRSSCEHVCCRVGNRTIHIIVRPRSGSWMKCKDHRRARVEHAPEKMIRHCGVKVVNRCHHIFTHICDCIAVNRGTNYPHQLGHRNSSVHLATTPATLVHIPS